MPTRNHIPASLWFSLCFVCCAFSAFCTPVIAQEAAPIRLCVTLRDERAAGVPGATVIVHNADAGGEAGRARTAADGSVCIDIPAGIATVRVELQGSLSAGTALYHQAADMGGILFFPGTLGETRLDLLVAADGLVLPNPAMWALDPLPAQETTLPFDPALPVATPARPVLPVPTVPTVPTGLPLPSASPLLPPVPQPTVAEALPPSTSGGMPFALLLTAAGVLLAIGMLLVFKRRRPWKIDRRR